MPRRILEQRNFFRVDVDCKMTYRFFDSERIHHGKCTSLSGAGIFFTSEQPVETGKGLEIYIPGKQIMPDALTAFIEVLRTTQTDDGLYEIAASIKTIKAA
ncbi:MAG: PilZ domain-containing protein [Gammaproteobacteria bacterium]